MRVEEARNIALSSGDEKYLRRGNIEIFCHLKKLPLYSNLTQIINKF